jgi:hypothetical protein
VRGNRVPCVRLRLLGVFGFVFEFVAHEPFQRLAPDVLAHFYLVNADLAVLIATANPDDTKTALASTALNPNRGTAMECAMDTTQACPDWSNIQCIRLGIEHLAEVVHSPNSDGDGDISTLLAARTHNC